MGAGVSCTPQYFPCLRLCSSKQKAILPTEKEYPRCDHCRSRHHPDAFCSGARRKSTDGQFVGGEAKPLRMYELHTDIAGSSSVMAGKWFQKSRRHTTAGMHDALDAIKRGDKQLAQRTMNDVIDPMERRGPSQKKRRQSISLDLDRHRDEQAHLRFLKEQTLKIGGEGHASLPHLQEALGENDPKPKEAPPLKDFVKQRHQRIHAKEQNKADVPWHQVNSSYKEDGIQMTSSMRAIKRRNSIAAIPMVAKKMVYRTAPALLPVDTQEHKQVYRSEHR